MTKKTKIVPGVVRATVWGVRTAIVCVVLALAAGACGGAEPEAEATWETHTTDPDDDTAGGEASAEETE